MCAFLESHLEALLLWAKVYTTHTMHTAIRTVYSRLFVCKNLGGVCAKLKLGYTHDVVHTHTQVVQLQCVHIMEVEYV